MFGSSTLAYKWWSMNLRPPLKGPLLTLLVMLLLELVSRTLLEIPSIAPLFLTIVYAAFLGGLQSGLLSAGITIAYALYSFALPGMPPRYTESDLVRVLLIATTAPTLALLVGVLKRRSERDQAETLRIQRYQTLLLQSVSDAIIATDADFRIQSWNRASELIYGWTAAEVTGRRIAEVIPTLSYLDDSDDERAKAQLRTHSFWKGLVLQRHRDGHEVLVESSVRMIYEGDGSLVGVVAVNRDVTESRQARAERERLVEQLEAQRARLETVLRQMPAGVAIAEAPSARLVLGNEQLAHMLRHPFYPAEDVAGYDQYQGFHLDGRRYRPEEWPLVRSIRSGEIVADEEIAVLRGDGTLGTISVSAAPIYDRHGAIAAGVMTFYDLTERKRIEESQRFLAQASTILADSLDYEFTIATVARLAIPHLADWCVIHLIGEDGTLRRPGVAHIRPELEALIHDLQRRYALDLSADGPIPRTLRTGATQLVAEVDEQDLRAVSQDEYHYQSLRELGFRAYLIVPISAHGRTLGAATFVSARRSYAVDDLELAQELMRRCGLAVDNARLYRDAQEALQTRDQLMLTVSHDLKNPLSAIKGYANFLRRRVKRMDVPETEWLEDGLSKIDATTAKMSALINEILDFARLQAGQILELNLRSTDLVALVDQLVAEYRQAAEQHTIRVVVGLSSLLGYYDTARLERVLANLLSNAIKYSPEGGEIVIEIEQADEARERWAVIRVRDSGLGIPAEDLPHIFDPFRRAGNVVGRVRGTGIGLTIARKIVEQHAGTLTVRSVLHAGSTFTIRLPVILPPDDEPSG
jgi:PAS domain S-box-containing protein